MITHKAAICTLALLATLILARPAPAAEKVTFGYFPVADFLITFIAKDRGFFDQHGIDATLQLMASNATSIPAAIVSDSIQIGGTTLPVVLQAEENGLNVKVVAGSAVYYSRFHAMALVVPAESVLRTAKDLEGKAIGLTGINNMVHILLVKWLREQGVDIGKIRFVEANIAQMPDILRAGQLDAVVAIEPFLTRIETSKTGRVFAFFQDDVPPGTATMIWALTSNYARAHPDTIKAVRAALADALAYHDAHPDEDDPVLAHYLPMPPAILKTLPKSRYVNQFDPTQIGFWSVMMQEQKLLTRAAEAQSVVVP